MDTNQQEFSLHRTHLKGFSKLDKKQEAKLDLLIKDAQANLLEDMGRTLKRKNKKKPG